MVAAILRPPDGSYLIINLWLLEGDRFERAVLACVRGNFTAPLNEVLHKEELKIFDKIKWPKKRADYLNGRWAAKLSLSQQLDEKDLTKLIITSHKNMRPFAEYPTQSVPEIGISHSSNAAVALSFPRKYNLAVDIEQINEGLVQAVDFFATPDELKILKSIPSQQKGDIESLFWSAKEAMAKLCGLGFTVPLNFYQMKSVVSSKNGGWSFAFTHFPNYTVTGFIGEKIVLCLAFPLSVDIEFVNSSVQDVLTYFESTKK